MQGRKRAHLPGTSPLALALTVLVLVVLPPVGMLPTAGAAAPTHDPILFVHGFAGGVETWNTMVSRFLQDGWKPNELFNWPYNCANQAAS